MPVDPSLTELARQRRQYLRQRAFYLGWEVIDLAAEIPPSQIANRIADGVYARYPVGDHQAAMTIALHRAVVAAQEQITCRLVSVPSIVYQDERWYLHFQQRGPVLSGSLWVRDSDGRRCYFSLEDDDRSAAAHVPLDIQPGISTVQWWTSTGLRELTVRVADLRQEYPIVDHVEGLPVGDQGRAVVLMAPRADERRLIDPEHRKTPRGRAFIFGDAPVVGQLQERGYEVTMVAGAALGQQDWQTDDPAILVWAPGNQEMLAGRWRLQEERILGVLRYRRDHLAPDARLLLVLPPMPHDPALRQSAHQRRQLLRSSAFGQGWEVLDTDDVQRIEAVLAADPAAVDLSWQDLPVSIFVEDEDRLIALCQPPDSLDGQAQIRWSHGQWQAFDLHDDGHARAYLPVPTTVGHHRLDIYARGQITSRSVHIAPQQGPWPIVAVRDGVPIDRRGDPVALLAARHRGERARTWRLLRRRSARPAGPPLVVGAVSQTDASAWAAQGMRLATEALHGSTSLGLITALTQDLDPMPRSLAWLPGPEAIADGNWCGEEERLVSVVSDRFASLDVAPHLLLLLPPLPSRPELQEVAQRRRRRLRSQALAYNWTVIDLDGFSGDLIRLLRARLR